MVIIIILSDWHDDGNRVSRTESGEEYSLSRVPTKRTTNTFRGTAAATYQPFSL